MKILFFDTWTKGIRNFSRLTPGLDKKNIEYKLLHLESWESPIQYSVSKIKGINCFDISFYNTKYIYRALQIEEPDMVVILSLSYLLDRTVVSMCQQLGIKLAYLSHGKIYMKKGVGNLRKSTSLYQKIITRLGSKKTKILFNYFYFNLFSRFRPYRAITTILEFLETTNSSMYTKYCEDFSVDVGMVYYESEKTMYEVQRFFPIGMIRAVGNPEIDSIVNMPIIDRATFFKDLDTPTNKYALYLDDGFVQENLMTMDEWEGFINEVNKPLVKNGISLIVKLHPRTDTDILSDFFRENRILAINDVDFKNIVFHSEHVLSHSSSTIVYGMILNKPIVLARWGGMENLVSNYPSEVVCYCHSLEEYQALISSNIPVKDTAEYINKTLGLVDGNAVKRIIESLLKILRS